MRIRHRRALPGLLLAAVVMGSGMVACAHMKNTQGVCPEYRNLRCLSNTRCSMDNQRGCQVCQCEKADLGPDTASAPDSNALPPTEP